MPDNGVQRAKNFYRLRCQVNDMRLSALRLLVFLALLAIDRANVHSLVIAIKDFDIAPFQGAQLI